MWAKFFRWLGKEALHPAFRLPTLIAVLAALAGVGLTAASGVLISRAALRPEVFLSLGLIVTLVRGLGVGRTSLRYAERLTSHAAALRLGTGLRLGLFDRLAAFGRDLSARERSGDLLSRLMGDTDARQMYLLRVRLPLAALGVIWLLITLWLTWLDLWLGLLAGLPLLLAALGVLALRGQAAALAERRVRLTRDHSTRLLDALAGAADGAARLARPELQRLTQQLQATEQAETRLTLWLTLWREGLFTLALLGVLWRGAELLLEGQLYGPLLAAAVLGTATAFELIAGLSAVPAAYAEWREAEERESAFAAIRPEVTAPAETRPLPAGPLTFSLQGVSVRRGGRMVLDGVSLSLGKGERVALTGPSGGGKSTLAALLTRDLDTSLGRVEVSGEGSAAVNVRDVCPAALRARISLHEQGAPLLDGSIAENLRLGGRTATDERLRALLDSLGLEHLPLDAWVGESGTRLSGGERARVSIARALLRPADLLILDEPTAHLDPKTETRVLEVIRRELAGRALLLVTHRPAPLALAERVYTLAGGKLTLKCELRPSLASSAAQHLPKAPFTPKGTVHG